jgi:hypothetical protein
MGQEPDPVPEYLDFLTSPASARILSVGKQTNTTAPPQSKIYELLIFQIVENPFYEFS